MHSEIAPLQSDSEIALLQSHMKALYDESNPCFSIHSFFVLFISSAYAEIGFGSICMLLNGSPFGLLIEVYGLISSLTLRV